jgi:hypothetical protein
MCSRYFYELKICEMERKREKVCNTTKKEKKEEGAALMGREWLK